MTAVHYIGFDRFVVRHTETDHEFFIAQGEKTRGNKPIPLYRLDGTTGHA